MELLLVKRYTGSVASERFTRARLLARRRVWSALPCGPVWMPLAVCGAWLRTLVMPLAVCGARLRPLVRGAVRSVRSTSTHPPPSARSRRASRAPRRASRDPRCGLPSAVDQPRWLHPLVTIASHGSTRFSRCSRFSIPVRVRDTTAGLSKMSGAAAEPFLLADLGASAWASLSLAGGLGSSILRLGLGPARRWRPARSWRPTLCHFSRSVPLLSSRRCGPLHVPIPACEDCSPDSKIR
jgi:hypothetical protein